MALHILIILFEKPSKKNNKQTECDRKKNQYIIVYISSHPSLLISFINYSLEIICIIYFIEIFKPLIADEWGMSN